jgi:hypothetical protein
LNRLFNFLPCIAVAWGVLALGGVHPWAYYPLLGMTLASGVYEVWHARDRLHAASVRGIAGALALIAAAASLQLLPLPTSVREAISPATDRLLGEYAVGYAASAMRPLSIDPGATVIALIFLVSLGTFFVGLIVRSSRRGIDDVVLTVTVVGAVIAIAALVQRASGTERVYGVWEPLLPTAVPYGPFVNRNHFAGWMLMALPFVLASGVAQLRADSGRRDARGTLVWLGSPQASWVLLAWGVSIVMGLALVLSLSRSGIATMALAACMLCGALVVTRSRRRRIAVVYTGIFLAVAFGWGGTQALSERFGEASHSVRARAAVWNDAVGVVRAFPVAGTGLNTYGTSMLFFQRADPANHYAQAHNDYLQLAAEGGLLIGIPALLLLAAVGRGMFDQLTRGAVEPTRVGAIVGVAAVLLQEMTDFSLQMPGNAVLFCVLCAAALRQGGGDPAGPSHLQLDGRDWDGWYNTRTTSQPAGMRHCPACQSQHIYRSKARTRWEDFRKIVTSSRPYRCHTCGWRGWGSAAAKASNEQPADRRVTENMGESAEPGGGTLRDDPSVRPLDLDDLDSIQTRHH